MLHDGYIDKLILLDKNIFFARGNNLASKLCNDTSDYILLLNSDVEIRNRNWLKQLMELHKRGVTTFGVVDLPPYTIGDGYCLLIDRDLYDTFGLDEEFEWWWAVTKLQAELLHAGYQVTAVRDHDQFLYHYRGKSGKAWKHAKGMEIEREAVTKWFKKGAITIIDGIVGDSRDSIHNPYALINALLWIKNLRKKISRRTKGSRKKTEKSE